MDRKLRFAETEIEKEQKQEFVGGRIRALCDHAGES